MHFISSHHSTFHRGSSGDILLLRDFSMKGPWGGSVAFLLYVFVTRSTSGCFRVISSIKDCENTEGTRKPLQFRDGFDLLLLQVLAGTWQQGPRGEVSLWSGYCTALAWICKCWSSSPGLALLSGDSSGWVTSCFNGEFQERSMPLPWRGRKPASCPNPKCPLCSGLGSPGARR